MVDNAVYCKNNMLVRQFDDGAIRAKEFSEMLGEAIGGVPGLVGMSHIYNNTGLACRCMTLVFNVTLWQFLFDVVKLHY